MNAATTRPPLATPLSVAAICWKNVLDSTKRRLVISFPSTNPANPGPYTVTSWPTTAVEGLTVSAIPITSMFNAGPARLLSWRHRQCTARGSCSPSNAPSPTRTLNSAASIVVKRYRNTSVPVLSMLSPFMVYLGDLALHQTTCSH